MTTYAQAMQMPKRQALEVLGTKQDPFTQEQLEWLKKNLEITMHQTSGEPSFCVRLYLERELICEAYS